MNNFSVSKEGPYISSEERREIRKSFKLPLLIIFGVHNFYNQSYDNIHFILECYIFFFLNFKPLQILIN